MTLTRRRNDNLHSELMKAYTDMFTLLKPTKQPDTPEDVISAIKVKCLALLYIDATIINFIHCRYFIRSW